MERKADFWISFVRREWSGNILNLWPSSYLRKVYNCINHTFGPFSFCSYIFPQSTMVSLHSIPLKIAKTSGDFWRTLVPFFFNGEILMNSFLFACLWSYLSRGNSISKSLIVWYLAHEWSLMLLAMNFYSVFEEWSKEQCIDSNQDMINAYLFSHC